MFRFSAGLSERGLEKFILLHKSILIIYGGLSHSLCWQQDNREQIAIIGLALSICNKLGSFCSGGETVREDACVGRKDTRAVLIKKGGRNV